MDERKILLEKLNASEMRLALLKRFAADHKKSPEERKRLGFLVRAQKAIVKALHRAQLD